jgi:hypothetical protein
MREAVWGSGNLLVQWLRWEYELLVVYPLAVTMLEMLKKVKSSAALTGLTQPMLLQPWSPQLQYLLWDLFVAMNTRLKSLSAKRKLPGWER